MPRVIDLVVEAIIQLHDRYASVKLAKVLPFSFVSVNTLKKYHQFLALCEKFRLDPEEGIDALKLNSRKVECVFSDEYKTNGQLAGFRRKEQ